MKQQQMEQATEIAMDAWSYRLRPPYAHVYVCRSYAVPGSPLQPWFISQGSGNGRMADYWREGVGWVHDRPTRYATAEDAARAFLGADERSRSRDE
jgi:hypothetical protein